MKSNFPNHPWFQRHLEFRCNDCGSEIAFRSRRRNFSERYLLPIFLLQPVRCGECFRRDYRLAFIPVQDRPGKDSLARSKAPTSAKPPDNYRNVA